MTNFGKTISISDVTPSQYKDFTCGIAELDEYLKRYAKNNEKKKIGRTFILVNGHTVIGFYTLSAAQISVHNIPKNYHVKLPAYPVLASRLCRLAVDRSFQGKHLGEHLLVDAMERVCLAAANIAIHAMVVDAKNESGKNFYIKYGFMPLEGNGLSLFIPLSTIEEIYALKD